MFQPPKTSALSRYFSPVRLRRYSRKINKLTPQPPAHCPNPTLRPSPPSTAHADRCHGVTHRAHLCKLSPLGRNVEFTVAEVKDGKATAYPSQDLNTTPTAENQAKGFVSVQSVVVDPQDRLWALDTGAIKMGPTSPGGPKLVCMDLASNKVTTSILVPPDVALPTTYLNDVRFDLRAKPNHPQGVAYITDSQSSGPSAIIAVDLASGQSWRNLSGHASVTAEPGFVPVVEGRKLQRQPKPDVPPQAVKIGADGIAISADGERLYYCPLISRKLFSVPTSALLARNAGDPQVFEEPERKGAADGLESDASGNLYFTDYENHCVWRRDKHGKDTNIAQLPAIAWPDTLSLSEDGYLYIMANQLHRQPDYNAGTDKRQKPYVLYRVKQQTKPIRLQSTKQELRG